jgi:histone-lysine N-methyltransferase SETMAR
MLGQMIASVFRDKQGILLVDFMVKGITIRTVRPNRNMKDVLLLHDNARPHTSLCTREAIAKMGRTVLPHPAHSPDLAPSDYHLFGPLKDAPRGRHFPDVNEIKGSFSDVLRSRGIKFCTTGIQRLTQRWQVC